MLNTALTRNYRPGLTRPGYSRDPFFSMFERFFGDQDVETEGAELSPANRNWLPPVDIYENENAFVATADLPGLDKKDIEVSLEDNVLTVSGERSYEKNGQQGSFRRVERAYGTFRRSFNLPAIVDATKVDARFENGVLTLTLPKSETAKSRKIDVG
jgi:HSP20 family protein